jgi:hypothetical protein
VLFQRKLESRTNLYLKPLDSDFHRNGSLKTATEVATAIKMPFQRKLESRIASSLLSVTFLDSGFRWNDNIEIIVIARAKPEAIRTLVPGIA